MHLVDGHMQAVIRYAVHREHASVIEEEMSAAVLQVIAASHAE